MLRAAQKARSGLPIRAPARALLRPFSLTRPACNTTADLCRATEVGAAEETQDVTTMDNLLRIVRERANPEEQNVLPMRSRIKWSETLRAAHSSPTASDPSDDGPTPHDLTPRTMAHSYCENTLRFATSPELFEAYTNTSGGIRTGKLMEHLDSLAGSIAYKHMLGPVESIGNVAEQGFYIVTASVDRLDMLQPLHPVRDIRLSGQVIHVGKSSMEIAVRMEALHPDGSEQTIMLGRFCMVCRDSKTHRASPVNPLKIETPEDEKLFQIGEAHKNRRNKKAVRALSKMPPSSEEAEALHSLYLQSIVDSGTSSHPRLAGDERIPMGETRLEKTLMMYPQERNVHQKIFGGYLMRLAYELGYTNSMLFTRGPVRFLALDSISFARPVPIGSVLRLKSYILHTASSQQYPALIHVGVKANVVDIRTGSEQMTNDFRFTWCREEGEPLKHMVVPMTYQEAMWWVEGKRALDLGAEIRNIRARRT